MKTFKNTLEFKYLFLFLVLAAAAFTSCKNDDNNATPTSGYIMAVNSADGSSSQDVYIDNVKASTTAVAYGSSSNYITTSSGQHTVQFNNSGSTTANASVNLSIDGGGYYTVYYTGGANTSTSNNYIITQDDLTAPPAGKAKVRFVHLASGLVSGTTSTVDFGIMSGSKFLSALAYKTASAYYVADPGTTFLLYLSGSANSSLNIPTTLQAGKIYTIFVSGSTSATVTANVIVQN